MYTVKQSYKIQTGVLCTTEISAQA